MNEKIVLPPVEDGERLGLEEFLADLRSELENAELRAAKARLKLQLTEITLSIEVAHTAAGSGEVGGAVKGKFWVFASAEASAKATVGSERAKTHMLTLTMKPEVEEIGITSDGRKISVVRSPNVSGEVLATEENPST